MKYHFMTDMDEHINQLFHDRRMTDNQLLRMVFKTDTPMRDGRTNHAT